jgi:hypothetical protein
MHHILTQEPFASRLRDIDAKLGDAKLGQSGTHDIPALFSEIPLDVFAIATCGGPSDYANMQAYFPKMPTDEFQAGWVGSSGEQLLRQSVLFVKTCIVQYETHSGCPVARTRILDYGVGWGRIIRLFNRFVPEDQLFGVDAWEHILEVARGLGVRANLKTVSSYPRKLPFTNKFDLILVFSIFTHLSEKSAKLAARRCAESLSPKGIFVATIRPIEFFQAVDHEAVRLSYETRGFGFSPHPSIDAVDGDVPYGDAAIAVDYIHESWPWLKIMSLDYSMGGPAHRDHDA